jgi:hypothetical protein
MKRLNAISIILALSSATAQAQAQSEPQRSAEDSSPLGYSLTGELGPVWQAKNNVEIPKDNATRFSFLDFGTGPFLAGRIYAGIQMHKLHEIRALYAPLALEASGKLAQDTVFMDQTFAANQTTKALFKFNSYRATYRYTLWNNESLSLKIGVTGKIRDAEIRLEQGTKTASRKNVGFVPLAHIAVGYKAINGFEFIADVDALAAPQGRAEDVALLMAFDVMPQAQAYVGYRTVEGGANGGGGVYNFTWFNYAVAGMSWKTP